MEYAIFNRGQYNRRMANLETFSALWLVWAGFLLKCQQFPLTQKGLEI